METKIVVISTENYNARMVCERIENMSFQNKEELVVELAKYGVSEFGCCRLTDFMDAVNNQELDNLTDSFISYVKLKN